jgi:hypothetical protein
VSIDYASESTNEVLASSVEYSSIASMTGAIACSGVKLDLNPGTDLYFRVKATGSSFVSTITALDVPARPSIPVTTINYQTETSSVIPSTQEWSTNTSMSPATQGENVSIPVTPGTDLYIRVKSTAASFASDVLHLVVSARPNVPSYTISYQEEKTNEAISTTDDYGTNSDLTGSVTGANSRIVLTPGTDLYFRTRATTSSFYSDIQHLTVAQRPETPVFTIDYSNVATNETASTNIEYSTNANLSGSVAGSGKKVTLNPGQDFYFRKKAGSTSFMSGISHLVVPERNFLGYSGNDTITSSKFTMYALLINGAPEFSLEDLQIANGTSGNLRAGNVFDVYPQSGGPVSVVIPANKVIQNSFVSNEVVVYYNSGTGLGDHLTNTINVFPNPSYNGIVYIQTGLNVPLTVGVYSMDGVLVRTIELSTDKNQQVNLQDLQKGIYFLRIFSDENASMQKLILE